MNDCKCKLVYKASDGKEFDTLEECQQHERRPRVYAIESYYENIGIHTTERTLRIVNNQTYIDKELAIEMLNRIKNIENVRRGISRGYRGKYTYELITIEVDITTQKSIQERLTNEKVESEKSWFAKIWHEFIKYRGDDK